MEKSGERIRSIEDKITALELDSVNDTRNITDLGATNSETCNSAVEKDEVQSCSDTLKDEIERRIPPCDPNVLFRMPISYVYDDEDLGTVVMGKIESGSISEGENLMIMPNKMQVKVVDVFTGDRQVKRAGPGEKLEVRVSGIVADDIMAGFVLCNIAKPIPAVSEFVAHLQILELPDNGLFSAGFRAMLGVHTVVEECEIVKLVAQIDPTTKKPMKKKPVFVKKGAMVVCHVQVNNMICLEKFSDFPQLGRFMLRSEKLAAVGIVTSLSTVSNK